MTYQDIKLADKTRNFSWVKELYLSEKFFIGDEKVCEETFSQFVEMIKLVDDIYTGAWDLDFATFEDEYYLQGIVIHFPHILITNRDKLEHNIEDLFVRIPLKIIDKRIRILKLQGMRTTLSYFEYCSNYFHSHLSMNIYTKTLYSGMYTDFCVGSGEIVMYTSNFNADGFSEEVFTAYLLQIMSLVGYESIEGTPFRYLKDIGPVADYQSAYRIPITYQTNTFLAKFLNEYKEETLDISVGIEKNKYFIDNDEKLVKLFKDNIVDIDDKEAFLCFNTPTGYCKFGSIPTRHVAPTVSDSISYIFQGRTIPMKVEEPPATVDLSKREYTLHPEVMQKIKEELENEINKRKIRESTIKRYTNTSDNGPESPKSDKISV